MELHQRQQFDFFLMTAIERFSETIVQRCAGTQNALDKMRQDRNGDGIWLEEYVDHLFTDFLYDNTAGACFILSALEKRQIRVEQEDAVEKVLTKMAKSVFSDLLEKKTIESLERSVGIGA